MTRPRRELDEALTQDVVNFLSKSWKLLITGLDPKQQAWAASSGQNVLKTFTNQWITRFMYLVGKVYKRDASDPTDADLAPQEIIWKKLEWYRLYSFLTKMQERNSNETIKDNYIKRDMLTNPMLTRVLQSMNYTPRPITMQILKSRNVISPNPLPNKKGGLVPSFLPTTKKYASREIALALITMACEKLIAMHYNLDYDSVTEEDELKTQLETKVKDWTMKLKGKLTNQGKIDLIAELLTFLQAQHDNIENAAEPDKLKHILSSDDTIEQIVNLELDDPIDPQEKNKFDQVMAKIKQSGALILNEHQYRCATLLLEAIDVSWNDLRFKADLTESHNGIIVMRPF